MDNPKPNKIRPYWHVDAKWICGILFALGLAVALNLYILTVLSSERIAIPIATHAVASLFSREGLDDDSGFEEIKQQALQAPGDTIETLPGVFVTKTDLEELSPQELRLKIFEQVVRPYYELGAEGVAASQTDDPEQQAQIKQQAGLLAFFNKDVHLKLRDILFVNTGLLLLPLAGLVYFSRRLGRLVSPGVIMAVVALPGAAITTLATIAVKSPPPNAGSQDSPLSFLTPEIAETIAAALRPGLLGTFLLGLALLLVAGAGKIWLRHKKPKT